MLIVLDVLLFISLVVILVMLLLQNSSTTKRAWKVQAYATICALVLELIAFILRLILLNSWLILLVLLIIHTPVGIATIIEAKDNGAFERNKKGSQNRNVDVVV